MRYWVRTGPRSGVSMPLWVAVVGYLFVWAAIAALVVVVVALVVAVVLAFLLMAVAAAAVGWVRRRAR